MVGIAIWAAKVVGVWTILSIVVGACLGSIFEANGETKDEVELDYRDNYRRYHKDDLRD